MQWFRYLVYDTGELDKQHFKGNLFENTKTNILEEKNLQAKAKAEAKA